ncbi:MAG: HD domain-containing protein [Spirochaetaceae bacterium]|nr:HD domain-containing protein [Spirochaetaceae bacterium]
MSLDKKPRYLIALMYGLITAFANLIGTFIPNFFKQPVLQTFYSEGWTLFMQEQAIFVSVINYGTFVIPTFLCILYGFSLNGKKTDSKFLNLPFAFSMFGTFGWLFYFIFEIIVLVIIKDEYNILIMPIIMTSFMYTFLQMMMSFSLAFFVMETLHRRIFLPKHYPNGHLANYKRNKASSLKFVFLVFYFSAVFFPLVYTLMVYVTSSVNNKIKVDSNSIVIFVILVIISCGITFILFDYFETPLKKLQKATKKISNGDYKEKVQIVTTDSFGVLADSFNDMADSLAAKNKKILSIQNSIVTGMATMVESRDNSTGGHIKRTSDCVRIFIEELRKKSEFNYLTDSFCQAVIKAAPMHDLGKIAVDDAILRKPGKFTDEEYAVMKSHSAEGAKIVANVLSEVDDLKFKQIAVNVAHYHHEKYDGTGYPCGLKGEDIPFEARIMALADVFDALVSKRCYKDSFSYDKAFQIIEESLGNHFDPILGKAFIACREKLEALYNEIE